MILAVHVLASILFSSRLTLRIIPFPNSSFQTPIFLPNCPRFFPSLPPLSFPLLTHKLTDLPILVSRPAPSWMPSSSVPEEEVQDVRVQWHELHIDGLGDVGVGR